MSSYPELLAEGHADQRSLVHVDRREERAVVTLSDPERLNPLSAGLVIQLRSRLAELAADPALRAIVITGEDPAFSAGGDLGMIEAGPSAIRSADEAADTTATDKAFVAAVNGPAAGVGLAFALACDIVPASERAMLVPAFGSPGLGARGRDELVLTRRLGYSGAMALCVEGVTSMPTRPSAYRRGGHHNSPRLRREHEPRRALAGEPVEPFVRTELAPGDLDAAVITHVHTDHVDPPALVRLLGDHREVFCPPGAAQLVAQAWRD